ncbi:MAG: Spy/CpxP family protein refolding chaperone [Bacteroidota bacterium]|nr:Spy/CpxP family protein refolding chaperone [Bacteroidota bacterium]
MRTKHLFVATAMGLLLLGSMSLNAQAPADSNKNVMHHQARSGMGMMHRGAPGQQGMPGLTDEQKTKIKAIHMATFKEVKGLKNQLGELKAKQRTLTTADKPDLNAINANIDDITKVLNKVMKAEAAAKQQVRALLTDEQKIVFDAHKGKFGMQKGRKAFGPAAQGFRGQNRPETHMQFNNQQ